MSGLLPINGLHLTRVGFGTPDYYYGGLFLEIKFRDHWKWINNTKELQSFDPNKKDSVLVPSFRRMFFESLCRQMGQSVSFLRSGVYRQTVFVMHFRDVQRTFLVKIRSYTDLGEPDPKKSKFHQDNRNPQKI